MPLWKYYGNIRGISQNGGMHYVNNIQIYIINHENTFMELDT